MNALSVAGGRPSTTHQVVVAPHPLTAHGRSSMPVVLVAGDTLASLLKRYDIVPGRGWVVEINGISIPEAMWSYTRPKDRTVIECRRVPEKDALRLVALIALAVYAPQLAGAIGITSKIGIALFTLAGTMVINKVLGPPRLKAPSVQATAQTYALTAARNQSRLYEPMGLVLGEPYMVPDVSSQPYTSFAGEDAYLTQTFHAGLNCDSVRDIRIGQTSISFYEGVQLTYDGFASIANTGMPSGSVDTVAGGLLDAPAGYGPFVTRTSSANTVCLAVDIEALLYYAKNDGTFSQQQVDIDLEFRLVGAGGWTPFVGNDAGVVMYNSSMKPYRVTFQRWLPAGQYEVRSRKRQGNPPDSKFNNTVTFTQLRSFQVDTGVYSGQSRFAVHIKASGQLNGALDEVNCRGRAKAMPFWNGNAWVTAVDRSTGLCNPGAIFLLLARGIWDGPTLLAGLGWEDSRIDIEGLKAFMVRCTAKGFYFDLFQQEVTSIDDLLEAVAYAGLATKSFHTGKLGVVWTAEDAPIEGVINMANMKAKSFSVDYVTGETADEVVLSYFDRERGDTWQSVRILAPGVTAPTHSTQIRLLGITSESHASVIGRFIMAQNVFVRKSISFDQDLEHMAYHRGTVLALSHDLTQWGYGGRLRGVVNLGGYLTLTLDDVVPAVGAGGATTRFIGLRLAGETSFRVFPVATFVGTSRTVTLDTPWPGGPAVPGSTADNPAHDCLWIYDFKATPGQKVFVTSVDPEANMRGATTVVAPMPDEFWPYVWTGAYVAPPSTSQLQALPTAGNLKVTEQLNRQGNTYYADLTLTFDLQGSFSKAEVWASLAGGNFTKLGETTSRSFAWRGGLDDSWVIELRPFSQLGRAGVRVQTPYVVAGLSRPGPAPTKVAVSQDFVFWKLVENYIAVAGYRIRSALGNVPITSATFARATPLYDGLVQASPWPLQQRLYGLQTVMVVMENSNGVWSDPDGAVLDFGTPDAANFVQVRNYQAEGFPGTYTNCTVFGGSLIADVDPASDLDALADWDIEPDLDATLYLPMTWIADPFVPSYGGGTMTLDYTGMLGAGRIVEYRLDGDALTDLDGVADWDLVADLDGSPSAWQPWPGALPTSRGYGYVTRTSIAGGAERGTVPLFTASLAAKAASQTFKDVAVSAAGTRLSPSAGSPAVKWISITSLSYMPIDDGTGAGAAFGGRVNGDFSPALGPLVVGVNNTGAAVDARLNIEVKGLIDA